MILIFLSSFLLNTYKIESGDYVIWDEAHFGKFSISYLKREFYFDVHPPLGKLMTTFSGLISGQDLDFGFESGEEYPKSLDYCFMRRFHAFISSFVPLLMYCTMRELRYHAKYSMIFSFFYIFENGIISISRLILLDSHLLLFTSCVIYTFTRFFMRKNNESLNLFFLGLSIGNVLSVKWIGCLTTLFVGIYIIQELYISLKYENFVVFLLKFMRRVFFLIIIPIVIYCLWFIIHFKILVNSSSDEAQMSSLFQLSLNHRLKKTINKYVEYGFPITLKSSKMTGGNLHSHLHKYPNHKENQVTTYHHKDLNDEWAFQKVIDDKESVDFLKDGDNVVLLHLNTKKYLGCSNMVPLVSKEGFLATCSDQLTQLNIWNVESETDSLKKESQVKSITTRFRLYNKDKRCYLASSSNTYPEWGFNQGEVICSKIKDESSLWNIEKNEWITDKNIEYKELRNIKNIFLLNFLELNKAMFKVNGSFKHDEDLELPRIVSSPSEWFLLKRGLRMVSWDEDNRKKFYMFGNPFIWYLSSFSILACPLVLLTKTIYHKRTNIPIKTLKKDIFEVYLCFFGWAFHYLPFFFVGRVLYFHHYFPAMIFAILSINCILKHFRSSMIILIIISFVTFVLFSPLTYGFKNTKDVAHIKLLKSWDFL